MATADRNGSGPIVAAAEVALSPPYLVLRFTGSGEFIRTARHVEVCEGPRGMTVSIDGSGAELLAPNKLEVMTSHGAWLATYDASISPGTVKVPQRPLVVDQSIFA